MPSSSSLSSANRDALNEATEAFEVARGLLRHLADLAEDTDDGVTLTGERDCAAMNVVYAAMRTLEAGQAAAERVFGTSAGGGVSASRVRRARRAGMAEFRRLAAAAPAEGVAMGQVHRRVLQAVREGSGLRVVAARLGMRCLEVLALLRRASA